jgi:hypothetical protein
MTKFVSEIILNYSRKEKIDSEGLAQGNVQIVRVDIFGSSP